MDADVDNRLASQTVGGGWLEEKPAVFVWESVHWQRDDAVTSALHKKQTY